MFLFVLVFVLFPNFNFQLCDQFCDVSVGSCLSLSPSTIWMCVCVYAFFSSFFSSIYHSSIPYTYRVCLASSSLNSCFYIAFWMYTVYICAYKYIYICDHTLIAFRLVCIYFCCIHLIWNLIDFHSWSFGVYTVHSDYKNGIKKNYTNWYTTLKRKIPSQIVYFQMYIQILILLYFQTAIKRKEISIKIVLFIVFIVYD